MRSFLADFSAMYQKHEEILERLESDGEKIRQYENENHSLRQRENQYRQQNMELEASLRNAKEAIHSQNRLKEQLLHIW